MHIRTTTTIFPSRLPTFRHLPRTTGQASHRRVIAVATAVVAYAAAIRRFYVTTARLHWAGTRAGKRRREHTRARNVFARVYGSLYGEPVFPPVQCSGVSTSSTHSHIISVYNNNNYAQQVYTHERRTEYARIHKRTYEINALRQHTHTHTQRRIVYLWRTLLKRSFRNASQTMAETINIGRYRYPHCSPARGVLLLAAQDTDKTILYTSCRTTLPQRLE